MIKVIFKYKAKRQRERKGESYFDLNKRYFLLSWVTLQEKETERKKIRRNELIEVIFTGNITMLLAVYISIKRTFYKSTCKDHFRIWFSQEINSMFIFRLWLLIKKEKMTNPQNKGISSIMITILIQIYNYISNNSGEMKILRIKVLVLQMNGAMKDIY